MTRRRRSMDRVDVPMSGAEKRRELRRSYENHDKLNGFSLNDIVLAGLVIIAMVVSLTDFTFTLGDFKNLTAMTLFLYVVTTIVYRNRYNKGKVRGRSDPEYIAALEAYREAKKKVSDQGIATELNDFCRAYKEDELRAYREGLLSEVNITYDEYLEKYRQLTSRDVMKLQLPSDTRRAILMCNKSKAIKLTPGLIMNENGEANRHRLVGQSGHEREIKDKRRDFVLRGLTVLLGGMIAVDVVLGFSFITIVLWFVRMIPVLTAIIIGEDSGFCNIAVTETNFKKEQTAIIGLFFEYQKNKPVPAAPVEDTTTE
jgi:hypothetical protein